MDLCLPWAPLLQRAESCEGLTPYDAIGAAGGVGAGSHDLRDTRWHPWRRSEHKKGHLKTTAPQRRVDTFRAPAERADTLLVMFTLRHADEQHSAPVLTRLDSSGLFVTTEHASAVAPQAGVTTDNLSTSAQIFLLCHKRRTFTNLQLIRLTSVYRASRRLPTNSDCFLYLTDWKTSPHGVETTFIPPYIYLRQPVRIRKAEESGVINTGTWGGSRK